MSWAVMLSCPCLILGATETVASAGLAFLTAVLSLRPFSMQIWALDALQGILPPLV
jgi:hypothetical protein